MTKTQLTLHKWKEILFWIDLDDDVLDIEEFSEILADTCEDYLNEQHQVIKDEIPDSFINPPLD